MVIKVSHLDFRKSFYVDLILDDAVIYELKTEQALTGKHHQQTLNYLLMLGMQHGKLINMRSNSVQSRFVSTRLTPLSRYDCTIEDLDWQGLDEDSIWLKQILISLLMDKF